MTGRVNLVLNNTMNKIQLILLFLFSTGVYSQDIPQINFDLKLSDSLTHDSEVRIYQGGRITNYSSLFRMYKEKSGTWTAEFYEHYAKASPQFHLETKKRILTSKSDLEFVFQSLLRSHILDLPNMKEVEWKLNTRGNVEKIKALYRGKIIEEYEFLNKQVSILDGEGFEVQVKAFGKNNQFMYSNPDAYLKHYPAVDELIYMVEILDIVRGEFHLWSR